MLQQFTAQYFQQSGQVASLDINVSSTSVRTVTLTNNDLLRGNDANDSIACSTGSWGPMGSRSSLAPMPATATASAMITDFNKAENTILFMA